MMKHINKITLFPLKQFSVIIPITSEVIIEFCSAHTFYILMNKLKNAPIADVTISRNSIRSAHVVITSAAFITSSSQFIAYNL